MPLLRDIGERRLIEDFRSFIRPEGRVGPGDDAAVIEKGVVATTDIVTFDRHFPAGMTYEQFGWYAAAVSFSDLAAMGARPTGFLAALALPPDLEAQAAYDIMSGIDQCAEFCGTGIVGGDTKPGPGIVAGTALGSMDGRKPMLRSGAVPGDFVAVTGPLGGPAAALEALDLGIEAEDAKNALYMPVPKVAEGMALAECGAVSSCMDLSDGLGTALNTLCSMSGVGMEIEMEFIPREDYVEDIAEKAGVPLRKLLFDCGGEYELLFTADRSMMGKIYESGTEFSIIGIVDGSGKAVLMENGERSVIANGRY